jgi:hypothetical protein
MFAPVICCLLSAGIVAQTPRDSRPPQPQPTGTGVITGRVLAGDTGLPLRRAIVQLSGPQRMRSTLTDADGRFTFSGLAKGTYTVNAQPGPNRAGFLSAGYGAAPGDPRLAPPMRPKPLELADGQRLENIEVWLPRAGAISGRVFDASGQPASRINVTAIAIRRGMPPQPTNRAVTDDLGQFRVYGLSPADYVISAEASAGGGMGPLGEMDGEPTGFVPTYAPGTPSIDQAQRIRLARGGHASVDVQLMEGRLFSVSGVVTTSTGETPPSLSVLIFRADQPAMMSSFGASTTPGGSFTIRNLPPGKYDIVARHMFVTQVDGQTAPTRVQMAELAMARIDLTTSDVEGLTLVTSPGETLTGEIVFDDGVTEGRRASVYAQMTGRAPLSSPPNVQVKGLTFTLRQVFGPILLRGSASGPGSDGWALKSVLLNGQDITDVPTALTAAHSGHVQMVFTGRPPSVDGVVTDDNGKTVEEYQVIVFGEEPESWQANATTFRVGRPAKDGKFSIRGMREGRYRVVAVPVDVPFSPSSPDLELLEALKKVATPLLLNAGETRTVDLRFTRIEQ